MHVIMLIRRIIEFGLKQPRLLVPIALSAQPKTCVGSKPSVCPGSGGLEKKDMGPSNKSIASGGVCDSVKGGGVSAGGAGEGYGGICGAVNKGSVTAAAAGGTGASDKGLKRALKPGKCRMGLIPEEWFLFFRPMTGVSGPYIFMLVLGNYLASKEILIMEHEYYLGLSIATVIYIITTRFGKIIGGILDKEVDAIANEYEKGRKDEIAQYNAIVADAALAKWRAEGQKQLMDAKKENIAMQLEAIYRERVMRVYQRVRGCMDFHVKRHSMLNRIHQKWMIQWILENVHKSITSELKQQAINSAIRDLDAIAVRTK